MVTLPPPASPKESPAWACGASLFEPADRCQRIGGHAGPMKPFSPIAKSSRNKYGLPSSWIKQRGSIMVGPHPQHDLPPISQGRPSRHGKPGSKPMTEVVTALFVFFSISVFLAHAFDAYYMR